MRLLRCIHSVSSSGGGPIEGIKQMSRCMEEAGHSVEVASLDPSSESLKRDFPFKLHMLGKRGGGYGFSPNYTHWLKEHHQEFDAVLVSGLWQYTSIGAWRALAGSATPYFVFPHGMLDPWFQRRYPLKHLKKCLYWPWAEYRVLRDAQAVLFTSEEERLQARQSFRPYRCREQVISYGTAAPTGDPEDQRRQFLEAYPHLQGKRILLFLGRLHEKKGLDLLIRAFAKVCSDFRPPTSAFPPSSPPQPSTFSLQPLHLVLAGPCADPAYLESLQHLANQQLSAFNFQLSAFPISFLPMLTGDWKWGAFHAADAFILPSHQENFGIAVAEALACGVPVLISNKVNIWREIEQDGAGLVDDDTVEGTERMIRKWESPEVRGRRSEVSEAAKRCFETRFEARHAAQRLIGLLEEEIRGAHAEGKRKGES